MSQVSYLLVSCFFLSIYKVLQCNRSELWIDNMSSFITGQIPKGSMCINTRVRENLFLYE
jgi:hypothetical protein